MTHHRISIPIALLIVALARTAEAGPPLICHPFQTSGAELLTWGTGPGWNSPDGRYEVSRLTDDVLRLLSPDAPILSRMENMRRATIYAAADARVADQLLQALLGRVSTATGSAKALALFDAGYLAESYEQSAHLHKRRLTPVDGYAMVARAIAQSGGNAAMEFAASLMTAGAESQAHLRRARSKATSERWLAENIETVWR